MTKCYIVEIDSCMETLFEELQDAGFAYHCRSANDAHMEVTIEQVTDAAALEEIMKWYV